MSAPLPALFLDRDGVVNVEKHYLHRIEDFEFMGGVLDLCRTFRDQGFKIVVASNQSGIARGYYTSDDVIRLHSWMADRFSSEGVPLSGVYFCPHHPSIDLDCACRKPRPGMLLEATRDLGLDLSRSVLLGDKETDLEAGRNAGIPFLGLVAGKQSIEAITWSGPVPPGFPPGFVGTAASPEDS